MSQLPPRNKPLKSQIKAGQGSFSVENVIPRIERTFLAVGTTIGKYRIQEEIDRGGMAVVYRALQLDLDREVALKVLPANITINRRFVDRFLAEAHAVARLSHPNIVSIHEVAMEDNVYFLAMDYIPGRNLYYHLHFGKPKLADVLEIAATLADALGYAHRQKIVHRDLKLNNVIMRDDKIPVLIDFGLAKALEGDAGTITQTGEIVGSPAYMAPERILGHDSDGRSDICSLGIMLYEMLTFKNPYLDPRSIHQTTMNVLECDPIAPRKLVPWLSPEIEAVTLKAMHADPEYRYQTMEEFAADIRCYQQGKTVSARNPSVWWRLGRFASRNWTWMTIFTLIIAFSALFGASVYLQSRKERPRWKLAFQENFDETNAGGEWGLYPEDTSWQTRNGAFSPRTDKFSFARLEKTFSRDIMIEFDIHPRGDGMYDAGFFMYGNEPDSAYRFYVLKDGKPGGIAYPRSDLLFRDSEPTTFPVADSYHVVVKRNEKATTLSINNKIIGVFWDFFPLLGKSHQKVGFFAKGASCTFDNLRVYRLTLPQLSSPTMVADRLWERGDFDAAMDEYNALLIDFPGTESDKVMKLRIAECQVRQGQMGAAREILSGLEGAGEIPDHLRPQIAFLKGIVQVTTRGVLSSFPHFGAAAKIARYHPVNHTSVAFLTMYAEDALNAGDFETAKEIASFCTDTYPLHRSLIGKIDCRLLSRLYSNRAYDQVLEHARKMETVYAKEPSVLAESRWHAGMALLSKREDRQALDKFNQSIASNAQGEQVWRSWMTLGKVYETNYRHRDAHGIYSKVYTECPKGSPVRWLARVNMAVIGRFLDDVEPMDDVLREVASAPVPFSFPRTLARYYGGGIPEEEFVRRCRLLGIGDDKTQEHIARHASIHGDHERAKDILRDVRSRTPFYTWEYVRLEHALKNTEQW